MTCGRTVCGREWKMRRRVNGRDDSVASSRDRLV